MAEIQFPPGVSRGATPAERQGRWYDANLVRWRDGRLQPVGGWSRVTRNPLPSPARRVFAQKDNADIKRIFIGCDAKLLVMEADLVRDITPAGFGAADGGTLPDGWGTGSYGADLYGTPRAAGSVAFHRAKAVWSLDSWGEFAMGVAASDGRLLLWTPATAGPAAVVAQAPTGLRGMVVTPERHVMAIGADGHPRRVAWSSREDYTDWNFADAANTAGYLELDSEGLLSAMCEVRDGTLVFSDSDMWLMQYVGAPFIYGRQRVGTSTSLLSPNTIATFGGQAVWMGKNGFWTYDAGLCKPLPCEVASFVFADIDPVYGPLYATASATASANGTYQEIWWFYPSKGSAANDRYAVWNPAEGWWSIGALGRTAMLGAGVHHRPLAVGADNHLYEHEDGSFTAAGWSRVGQVWVESASFGGTGQTAVLRGQLDNGVSPDATRVVVKARQTRDGPDRVFGPYAAAPDGRVAMRAGGQDVRIRIEAAADADFSVGRMLFDVGNVGRR